jgi:hypothetical protein
MREKLTTGEVPFRKAYLNAIIDRVEVDDGEIRIVGRKDVLERAVLAGGGPTPGVRELPTLCFSTSGPTSGRRCKLSLGPATGLAAAKDEALRPFREVG